MEQLTAIFVGNRQFTVSKDDERRVIRVTGEMFNRRGGWLPGMEDAMEHALIDLGLPIEYCIIDKLERWAGAEWSYSGSRAVFFVRGRLSQMVKEDTLCQSLVERMEESRRRHFLARDLGIYRPDRLLHDDHKHWLSAYRMAVAVLYERIEHPWKWLAEEQMDGAPITLSDPVGNYFYHPGYPVRTVDDLPATTTKDDLEWLREHLDKVSDRLVQWRDKVLHL